MTRQIICTSARISARMPEQTSIVQIRARNIGPMSANTHHIWGKSTSANTGREGDL